MLYRRGGVWWYEFAFCGQRIRESSKSNSKTVARDAERTRRRQLEEGLHGIKKHRARLFTVAAEEWLAFKRPHLAPRSVAIEEQNLEHLKPHFGGKLLGDIAPEDVARYQQARLDEGASPKTINLEMGTVRAILRRNRLWANLQPDVKMLPTRDDIGQAITPEQETKLLEECNKSRSRSLYPAVTLALSTAMRYSEIRLLTWKQIDFVGKRVWVGASKTEYGEGRPIPMNGRAFQVMSMWAEAFPNRQPEHFVFPAEKYGAAGDDFKPCFHSTDPTKPIGDWKEAWEAARKRAGVSCRFHDLRHTACTRMLESGTPLSVVATIMGWSPSTTVRMSRRYGHIGQAAQVEAVKALEGKSVKIEGEYPQNPPQFQMEGKQVVAN
ncbi:MAG TPA: tyrosine-type recombinase/integrase [Terriglobia bacterium]|nr:tyrosine-type recombinase/integrase [Terriglobia bacterium]